MTGVVSIFAVLLIWRFLIIFGAAVFEGSGLAPKAARFEAQSAIVGAGYTTSESEYVVRHPVARRVASMLIIIGYFGPATILALLGVSFVIPTNDDLSDRGFTLLALLVGLYAIDRVGIIAVIGSRPARALAKRMLGSTAYETWIGIGDRAVAAIVVPSEASAHETFTAALNDAEVIILAVEPAGGDPATFPTESGSVEPAPGDRVMVFGPKRALAPLGGAS